MPWDPDIFTGSDVLVTGGLGFIGSALARRLVELGAKVTLVDSLIPEYGGNLFNIHDIRDRVTVDLTDVRDAAAMSSLIKKRQFLFNLAGQTSHLDSMTDPMTDLNINAAAQLHILEACRLHNRDLKIVFASTRQVYGRPEYLPVDEKHPIEPVDVQVKPRQHGQRSSLCGPVATGLPTPSSTSSKHCDYPEHGTPRTQR